VVFFATPAPFTPLAQVQTQPQMGSEAQRPVLSDAATCKRKLSTQTVRFQFVSGGFVLRPARSCGRFVIVIV
jgi:hypothetical protein